MNQSHYDISHTNISQINQYPEESFDNHNSYRQQQLSSQLKLSRDQQNQEKRKQLDLILKQNQSQVGVVETKTEQKLDTCDEPANFDRPPILHKYLIINSITSPPRLNIETWLWEKEQSHRLFNFHDEFRVQDKQLVVVGSTIVSRKGANMVGSVKASEHENWVGKEEAKDNIKG